MRTDIVVHRLDTNRFESHLAVHEIPSARCRKLEGKRDRFHVQSLYIVYDLQLPTTGCILLNTYCFLHTMYSIPKEPHSQRYVRHESEKTPEKANSPNPFPEDLHNKSIRCFCEHLRAAGLQRRGGKE